VEPLNVLGEDWDERSLPEPEAYHWRHVAVGRRLAGELLGGTVYELDPGQKSFPYHWHAGNEELLIVLSGRPALRTPDGERTLEAGDVVVFACGPDGAHQLRNDADKPVRILMLSTRRAPEAIEYPDSGKIGVAGPGVWRMLRADAEIHYWEGEK
jgi:uncharacterized cupin superfamily protein